MTAERTPCINILDRFKKINSIRGDFTSEESRKKLYSMLRKSHAMKYWFELDYSPHLRGVDQHFRRFYKNADIRLKMIGVEQILLITNSDIKANGIRIMSLPTALDRFSHIIEFYNLLKSDADIFESFGLALIIYTIDNCPCTIVDLLYQYVMSISLKKRIICLHILQCLKNQLCFIFPADTIDRLKSAIKYKEEGIEKAIDAIYHYIYDGTDIIHAEETKP